MIASSVIYKQKLAVEFSQGLRLPKDSKILCAREQLGQICIWYQFDIINIEDLEEVVVYVYGTGHKIDNDIKQEYIDTVFINQLVFHIFKEIK